MDRFRFSSPSILLILAACVASGTLLLDICVLRPHMESHKTRALFELTDRTQGNIERSVATEARVLSDLCGALCESGQRRTSAATVASTYELVSATSRLDKVDVAWVRGADGQIVRAWPDDGATLETSVPSEDFGIMVLRGAPVIFARQDIRAPDRGDGLPRQLYLARRLTTEMLAGIGSTVQADLTLVCPNNWPTAPLLSDSVRRKIWLTESDRLIVAWPTKGADGEYFGYFLAGVSASHVCTQLAAFKSVVLILLWVSGGTVILFIVGVSIFLANPACRLLGRLHNVESGEYPIEREFTRNLHAESRVLAKRLYKVFETITDAASIDSLTGLANRRHFDQMLKVRYRQAHRYHRMLSALIIDIDLFKAINDTCGHQSGDEFLKAIGRIIREQSRDTDVLARIGGDEFAMLLPETSSDGAAIAAERIRQAIAAESIMVNSSQVHVTVSIGIADFNSGRIEEPRDLIALADNALFAAKQQGRNRFIQAHDVAEPLQMDVQEEGERIKLLRGKLTGLDAQFKDLFMRSLHEIVQELEFRDAHMGNHAHKVQCYARLIARRMGLSEDIIKCVELSALLHDIGMMALPDSILLCQGRLNEAQQEEMRRHPLLGSRILAGIEFLGEAIPAVRSHHECFDGSGYPDGLAREEIPLSARIISVADTFDAMTSPRTFRSAKSVSEAITEIREDAHSQFDTRVVAALAAEVDIMGDGIGEVAFLGPFKPNEAAIEGDVATACCNNS